MKKYVLIMKRGSWEFKDGKLLIDCTIKERAIVAQADKQSLLQPPLESGVVAYYANGTWEQFEILPRKWAKYEGLQG